MVHRRALLGGAIALAGLVGAGVGTAALAAKGVIPGKNVVDERLGHCDVEVPAAPATPGPVVAASFASTYRKTTINYRIAYPPGAQPGAKLPVCLMLHGYAEDEAGALRAGNYPAYLAAAVNAGGAPFALASVAGGNGYWHPHPADDPLGMLLNEFLPLLGTHGLSIGRPAVCGNSMGGYGALLCALTAPDRFASVIANSPAFWRSYPEAHRVNPVAFSSAREWTSYGDLLARPAALGRLPMQVYIGASDPFEPIVNSLRDRLPDPTVVHVSKGCHDGRFWSAHAPTVLRTIGAALAD